MVQVSYRLLPPPLIVLLLVSSFPLLLLTGTTRSCASMDMSSLSPRFTKERPPSNCMSRLVSVYNILYHGKEIPSEISAYVTR